MFTKEARALREEGRQLLDAQMLLYIGLRCEHRRSHAVRFATLGQNLHTTTGQCFERHLHVLKGFRLCVAATQSLLGVVRIYNSILSCFDIGCAIPRQQRIKKEPLRAFISTIAFRTAGKVFPTSACRVLELLFRGTYEGLPTDYAPQRPHCFSEPVRRSDAESVQCLDARQRETARQRRARVSVMLERCLQSFKFFCRAETYFFKARVAFYASNWPSTMMTAPGVTQFLQKTDCNLLPVPDEPHLGKGESCFPEPVNEFDLCWNPLEHSPLMREQDAVHDLLAGHLEPLPPDPEADNDVENGLFEEAASKASACQPANRVRLPCRNDPCVQSVESSISSAKVPIHKRQVIFFAQSFQVAFVKVKNFFSCRSQLFFKLIGSGALLAMKLSR